MDPVTAVRRFSEVMNRALDTSVRLLAPAEDPATSIGWTEDWSGNWHLAVTLRSGRVIRGDGPAKMEAALDAERRALGGGR